MNQDKLDKRFYPSSQFFHSSWCWSHRLARYLSHFSLYIKREFIHQEGPSCRLFISLNSMPSDRNSGWWLLVFSMPEPHQKTPFDTRCLQPTPPYELRGTSKSPYGSTFNNQASSKFSVRRIVGGQWALPLPWNYPKPRWLLLALPGASGCASFCEWPLRSGAERMGWGYNKWANPSEICRA